MEHVAIVAVVVGGAVFGIIQGADAFFKQKGGEGLSPNLKFWGAVALSFLIPLVAYVIVTLQDTRTLTINGVFLAAATGFTAATALHWVTGGSQRATAVHEAELHPGTPKELPDSTPASEPNKEVTVE